MKNGIKHKLNQGKTTLMSIRVLNTRSAYCNVWRSESGNRSSIWKKTNDWQREVVRDESILDNNKKLKKTCLVLILRESIQNTTNRSNIKEWSWSPCHFLCNSKDDTSESDSYEPNKTNKNGVYGSLSNTYPKNTIMQFCGCTDCEICKTQCTNHWYDQLWCWKWVLKQMVAAQIKKCKVIAFRRYVQNQREWQQKSQQKKTLFEQKDRYYWSKMQYTNLNEQSVTWWLLKKNSNM